ncbi:MAG TPA: hypothetical protein VK864_04420, partial [Longimicrobiales bacterium]|nr:hypothetical protein [Longimicrobiales bacterium]
VTDWGLALALDDRAGFTPARPQVTMPSWNIPDIYTNLAADFSNQCNGGCFLAEPLAVRDLTYGSFTSTVNQLRGGSVSVFELSGAQTGRQVLEMRSLSGGAPPASLRLTIVRVQ